MMNRYTVQGLQLSDSQDDSPVGQSATTGRDRVHGARTTPKPPSVV